MLSPKDAQNLFARYDEDGSGRIDIYELMRNILPRDYSAKTWVEKSEQKRRSFNTKRKKARRERLEQNVFQSIQYPRALRSSMGLSTEAVLQLVRDKINGKARAATDVLRQAFFLFDRKTSLSPEDGICFGETGMQKTSVFQLCHTLQQRPLFFRQIPSLQSTIRRKAAE